jgi:ABC-type phosphate/phosphonate transport system substrate-binding protein
MNEPPSLFAVCPHDTARGIDRWALLNTYVNKRLSLGSRFHPYLDFAEFGVDLERERFLWAYLNPADTLKARSRFGYEALVRPSGRFDVAYIVRAAGAPLAESLEGKRVAAVNGYLFFLVRKKLADAAVGFETVVAKSYAEVLTLVDQGKADAGVTYNEHFDVLAETQRSRFAVVDRVHPGLSHVIAAHPSVPLETRSALRELLLAAGGDPQAAALLADLKMVGFENVPEAPFALLSDVLALKT